MLFPAGAVVTLQSSGWMVHYYCSSLSQAIVCARTLNYVHIQLDWLTVQVATGFIVHEDMATELQVISRWYGCHVRIIHTTKLV